MEILCNEKGKDLNVKNVPIIYSANYDFFFIHNKQQR